MIPNVYSVLGGRMTKRQVLVLVCALVGIVITHLLTRYTKLGKAMRAVADDHEVASTVCIDVDRIRRITVALSSILATVAGILLAFESNLGVNMGMNMAFRGMIAIVVGGLGSVPGAMLGGFLIGLAENIGIWYLPSSYKDAIALILLVVFLVMRPYGVLGLKREQVVKV
jgi:branched-chain amino acid transport system permease protein